MIWRNAPDAPIAPDAPDEDDNADFDPEKPVELPITDTLDLHPFRPNEIRDVVNEYLQAARDKGFRQLRLIHGKGKGVQRANVQGLLGKHPLVQSFRDADPMGGGWGATLVELKP